MFEKYQPVLAHIEVEGRGPALPRRITNFYRFIPSRIAFYRAAINKLVEIKLGRSLWRSRHPEGYSAAERRRAVLHWAEAEGLFQPAAMRSAKLYRLDQLQAFLSEAQADRFKHDEFLGRIITVEMALRAVGASLP
jgi:hypothetical protein